MGEQTNTATPPAASGGITLEQINAAIASAIKPLSDGLQGLQVDQKVLADTLAQLPPATDQEAKALTLQDVETLLSKKLGEAQSSQRSAAQREQYIAAHLGKLPAAYRNQLGGDPAKWAEEAKAIQSQFEADFKAAGGTPETIASGTTDGGKTAAKETPDYSKLPAFELLHKGVEALPVGPAGAGK